METPKEQEGNKETVIDTVKKVNEPQEPQPPQPQQKNKGRCFNCRSKVRKYK